MENDTCRAGRNERMIQSTYPDTVSERREYPRWLGSGSVDGLKREVRLEGGHLVRQRLKRPWAPTSPKTSALAFISVLPWRINDAAY